MAYRRLVWEHWIYYVTTFAEHIMIPAYCAAALFPQLQQILSMGFQNKFYSAAEKKVGHGGQAHREYRINVSSDTPHWYVRDYLTRVSQHYHIEAAHVGGTSSPLGDHQRETHVHGSYTCTKMF